MDPVEVGGIRVEPGESREIYLKASESFAAGGVHVPITVVRGKRAGPAAFITAAVHGDEINGVDIVRRLILDLDPETFSGTLIAVPVVNIPGFLELSRYLPYHRDLNRFFPGKQKGHNAERFAWRIFREVISRCDFGIDLHTASDGRWNLPHVRGDMSNARVRKLAREFGATVVVDNEGLPGSLRCAATRAGVPTILFEAGEAGRFSRRVSLVGARGVLAVLAAEGMVPARERRRPPFQVIVKTSDWVRAERGGILDLSVKPGDLVYEGDLVASILNPFGRTVTRVRSNATGIVIGVTTAPLAIPGTGIAHVARLRKTLARVERSIRSSREARVK